MPTSTLNLPALTLNPAPAAWKSALSSFSLPADSRRFREQLGLPTDKPIIMTGHQAMVWHPGILAKYLAADAASVAYNATPVWIVVDQDTQDPFSIRYPVADGATLAARTWRADGADNSWGERYPEVPVGLTPAFKPAALPTDLDHAAAPHVRAGLTAIRDALARHAGAASAARQLDGTLSDLLAGIIKPAPTVYALDLCKTDLFASLIAKMTVDPTRCIDSYQRAVRTHPDARVAPLHDGELPMWAIPEKAGSPRKRATVAMLASGSKCGFSPRALLMTAIFRMAGCEMFIHGTGGAGTDGAHGYDAITDEWIRDWLGVKLSPVSVVTATLRLNFDTGRNIITPEQIAHARWLAHSARHHPILLNDAAAEAARASTLNELKPLRWKRDADSRRAKHAAYRALHDTLTASRTRHAAELAALESEAKSAADRRAESEIIADRTWAFPLYEAEQVRGLRETIAARFSRPG